MQLMNWNGKIGLLVVSLWLFVGCGNGNSSESSPQPLKNSIIPTPQLLTERPGFFRLKKDVTIYTDPVFKEEAVIFCKQFNWLSNIELTVKENIENKTGVFIQLKEATDSSENKVYHLEVSKKAIVLASTNKVGIANGLQSIYQLILLNQRNSTSKQGEYLIPSLSIDDWAKFKHRGLLLDCSRHFFSKEVIKKYIDLLAFYKMNVLHWHLTEDQGWRIEIDKYPQLTEVGAWRTEKNGEQYGGFYTKKEIKEIVAYAQKRHVTVIPEIELPGHSQAAIAAYPQLSCTGEQVEVINDWGVFKEIYCAGNDSVFTFMEDVLTEVMELFPSQYIHIGGDETPKYRWEHCEKCQKRMTDEGLKDEHELQSYFVNRIEKFLNKNGRNLIGWDEILEGGLSENATLQSWRGFEGGIAAANANHNAIMSPTSHAYFDYDLKAIDLEKVYNFDPIPEELTEDKKQFIIGGECNLWSEHVPNEKTLDRQVFPRLLAMSEVLWNAPKERNYNVFYNQVQTHYPILDLFQVQYGLETLPATIDLLIDTNHVYITLEPGNPDLELTYQWICDTCVTYCDTFYTSFKKWKYLWKINRATFCFS